MTRQRTKVIRDLFPAIVSIEGVYYMEDFNIDTNRREMYEISKEFAETMRIREALK